MAARWALRRGPSVDLPRAQQAVSAGLRTVLHAATAAPGLVAEGSADELVRASSLAGPYGLLLRNSRLAAPCRTPFGPAPPSLRRRGHDEGSAALPRRNRHLWPTASVSPDKRITAIKDIAAEFNPSFVPHGRVTSHSSLAREVIRRECAVFASLMVFACLSVL